MMSRILLYIGAVLFLGAAGAWAQPGGMPLFLEDLPRRPLDTIPTPDPETKVIIYSNNTWSYYRPDLRRLENLPVFRNHWDTAALFVYRDIELGDLPETIELRLIDSLDEFCVPVRGYVLSKYGPRRRRNHNGVDIPMMTGEPILAAFDGKVRVANYNTGGFGNLVILRHPNGLETWYAHLSKHNVRAQEYVKAGQVIGYVGNTGRSRGPHLHFEVRYCDQTFDPEFLFDFRHGRIKYQTFVLERSYFNIRSRASELLEEEDDDFDPAQFLAAADDSTLIRAAARKEAMKPTYHTVRSGEVLGRIAARYDTTVDNLCRLNKISRTTTIRAGQRLRIR